MKQHVNLKAWFLATRPWSFPASMMPALMVFAYVFYLSRTNGLGEINILNGLLALLGVVFFQAAGNLISDYFDYQFGVDRKDTYGSSRLIVDGLFSPKTIFHYGLVLLALASFIGIILLANTSIQLLSIGLIGVVGTYFYYQLKYHALGDLVIFILYGLLIAFGTMFVVTGEMDWNILLISTPIGLLIVNILHANNTRDIEPDHRAGIATFAMKIGLTASKWIYCTHALMAYLLVVLLIILGRLPLLCILVFISIPLAVKNIKVMMSASEGHSESIKDLDKGSAMLVMLFSLLLIIGNILAGVI